VSTFLTVAVTGLRRALLAAACWLALAGLMPAAPSAARAPADAPRVTVRALGVDHDQNIDLVVSAVPSGEVVAVWLNDGRGGFTEGNVSALSPLVELRQHARLRGSGRRRLALERRSAQRRRWARCHAGPGALARASCAAPAARRSIWRPRFFIRHGPPRSAALHALPSRV